MSATDLEAARERLREAESAVDEYGEPDVNAVATAYERAMDLLSQYEESATGTGDFAAYVEFQEKFVRLVEGLDDSLPTREAFVETNDHLDRRRLSEAHFEQARDMLEAAGQVANLLDEREDARESLRETRRAVERRLSALDDRIADHERLIDLGEADLDAPTEELREPIEAYDEAVQTAFSRFRSEASARSLCAFVATTEAYPLVAFDEPPADLVDYLQEEALGDEPLSKLLTYVDYSRSKLDHYVDDAARFRRHVATNETYLARLDADPLTVGWPPSSRGVLRHRAEELVSVVARFADEEVVAHARAVRDLTFRDDYETLRRSAVARAELSKEERQRLEAGTVAAELEDLRAERERLQAALDATRDGA